MMDIDDKIAVLQAAKAGKPIQRQDRKCQFRPPWYDDTRPTWNFDEFNYRVKPAPRTIWVNEYDGQCGKFDLAYSDFKEAVANVRQNSIRTAVKFVEVIE